MSASKASIKTYFKHLSIILGILMVLLYTFFYIYLPTITKHGEAIEVPNFNGMTLDEVSIASNSKLLRLKIFDSTFTPGIRPLTVLNQFPKAGEKVKSNRTIYISIASKNPPGVRMPKLIGTSLKAAEWNLKSHGLMMGNIKFVPSANNGAVLEQLLKGKKIEPDVPIKKGSIIDLVVGNGLGDISIQVPNLIGIDINEAKKRLLTQGLEIGSVVYEEKGSLDGKIIRQKPEFIDGDSTNTLKKGEIIDLWISGIKPTEKAD
jgi:beta-lactam-binding protein with PASTA domain